MRSFCFWCFLSLPFLSLPLLIHLCHALNFHQLKFIIEGITDQWHVMLFQATRRPRELFKRSSDGGGKTGAVAPSDIKPQVL